MRGRERERGREEEKGGKKEEKEAERKTFVGLSP